MADQLAVLPAIYFVIAAVLEIQLLRSKPQIAGPAISHAPRSAGLRLWRVFSEPHRAGECVTLNSIHGG